MTEARVVVVGDSNVDMVLRPADHANRNPAPELHGGGTAANVSVGLSRLGASVAFVGAVGNDHFGTWVRDDLLSENIVVEGLKFIDNEFTVLVMAVIDQSGERQIYVWPPQGGPHLNLEPVDVNLSSYPNARWLHTTGICLRGNPAAETILAVMEQARSLGWTVSIDLNLRMESWGLDTTTRQFFQRAITNSDIAFGNASEEIMPLAEMDTPEKAVQALCADQRTVIARLGERGALVCTPNDQFQSPAFATQIVDTLGAGDAFDAGFIMARLSGSDIEEAARWGNAVAALKIQRPGARGLPTLEELQKRIAAV